jgi:transcriptional regulator with XRE-family HTH domain
MALQINIGRSRLPELLAAKRMSQAEFSRKLDVSESFITQVIGGKSYFSYLMARKASKTLGCTMEDLHEWIETKE